MGAPFFQKRTVGDAARDLIRAADMLERERGCLDRTVAALEARWAANRVTIGTPAAELDAINLVSSAGS